MSVPPADPAQELLAALVACDSTNPSLVPGGAGESAIAALVARALSDAGLSVERWEALPGRECVLGVLPGSGGGRSLLLCSHLDVVGGTPEQFVPRVRDGRMYGRGALDMKGGLAASILAARASCDRRLCGDLLVAGVIDEEWLSAGAIDLVARLERAGTRVAGAILPEPTELDLIVEHGGFAWWQLTSVGAEAAGDDPDQGIDAIALAGSALSALAELDDELARRPRKPYGRPNIHASTIAGGSRLSAYPASCQVGIERCLVPGETVAGAQAELEAALERARSAEPRLRTELELIVGREAIELAREEPVVAALERAASSQLGRPAIIRGDMGWMDSGILVEAGIPCVAFGPSGAGEHTGEEWVDLESVRACARILAATARAFCA